MSTSPAERVVQRCGGRVKLAAGLGHRNPTTVQGWLDRGVVPVRQIPKVIAFARSIGIELSLDDFFDIPRKRAA